MARKKIIAGNWKMNMTPSEAVALVETLKPLVQNEEVDVVFGVPAIDIVPVVEACKGTNIQVAAENMYYEEKGAYTGEIAPAMLVDAGVKYVILGHSERRDYFKETSEDVNKKVLKAFEHGLTPIMCCGESLEQRRAGHHHGLDPSAGEGWIPECDRRAGEDRCHRVRADLGHRHRKDRYQPAGRGRLQGHSRVHRGDL